MVNKEDEEGDREKPRGKPSVLLIISSGDDGTEAWCLVLCCFLVHMLVMGVIKCLGILHVEITKGIDGTTDSEASTVTAITSSLNCIAAPLACYLLTKFTARSIAFVGTSLTAFGLMISYFATDVSLLYFSIGACVGGGSGLTYPCGVILIGNYFQTGGRLGMANGLVVAGAPFGGMVMPFMLTFLITTVDIRGALLILGGLLMNAVVCTLAYIPYKTVKPPAGGAKLLRVKGSSLVDGSTFALMSSGSNATSSMGVIKVHEALTDDDSSGPEFSEDENASKIVDLNTGGSASSVVVYRINEKYGKPWIFQDGLTRRRNKSQPIESKPANWPPPVTPKESSASKKSVGEFHEDGARNIQSKQSQTEIKGVVPHPFQQKLKRNSVVSGLPPKSPKPTRLFGSIGSVGSIGSIGSNASFHSRKYRASLKSKPSGPPRVASPYVMSLDPSCVIMWSNEAIGQASLFPTKRHNKNRKPKLRLSGASDTSLPTDGDDDGPLSATIEGKTINAKKDRRRWWQCRGSCWRRLRAWIRDSPLSNKIYLVCMFSQATVAIGTTNVLLMIPKFSIYRGLSSEQYSTVYLIVSAMDLTGRLLGAYIADKKYLSYQQIYAAGLAFAGCSSILINFGETMLTVCIFCGLFGFGSGTHTGIFGVHLAKVVGVKVLHIGYAFVMLVNGALQLTSILMTGAVLKKDSDAFSYLYGVYGVILIGGSSPWIVFGLMDFYSRFRKRNAKSQNAEHSNASLKSGESEDDDVRILAHPALFTDTKTDIGIPDAKHPLKTASVSSL